jgi:hypothetical protein
MVCGDVARVLVSDGHGTVCVTEKLRYEMIERCRIRSELCIDIQVHLSPIPHYTREKGRHPETNEKWSTASRVRYVGEVRVAATPLVSSTKFPS